MVRGGVYGMMGWDVVGLMGCVGKRAASCGMGILVGVDGWMDGWMERVDGLGGLVGCVAWCGGCGWCGSGLVGR